MITPDRFIARSSDRELWLAAREDCITATMVANAATPAGFAEVIARIEDPQPIVPNAYMEWGTFREGFIALELKDREGIMPNEWLIAKDSGLDRWMAATPDGLSLDHTVISEIKTSGKPLHSIPIRYRRQMQWQLHCTSAERVLFCWELRLEGPDGFVPDFDIHTQWVERDPDMIRELVFVAEQLQQHLVYRSWDEREEMENGNG